MGKDANPVVKSVPRIQTVLRRAATAWRAVLYGCFLLLCLRFLVAAVCSGYPYTEGWTTLVLIVGGVGLGAWNTVAVLFAFIAAVPLLNGLGYVGLEGIASPPCLVFASLFVGISLRRFAAWCACPVVLSNRVTVSPSNGATASRFDSRPAKTVQLVTDVLITIVLVSFAMQIVRHLGVADFWMKFWTMPVLGYGDPAYFVSSAYVSLEGLFLFRLLCFGQTRLAAWVKPVFIIYGLTLATFMMIQVELRVPDPLLPYSPWTSVVSPLEDIHSFGSFAVSIFAFFGASWPKRSWAQTTRTSVWTIGLLGLVIASWSRATWLVGVICLLLIGGIRFGKRWTIISVALLALALVEINQSAKHELRTHNAYLERLASLALWQNPESKIPTRIYLYKKAVSMICEHPMMGGGVGSFYLSSVRFAWPGDPNANVPNFAHNFLLQLAAELGLPVTALFAALIGYALWRGFRRWRGNEGERDRGRERGSAGEDESERVGRSDGPTVLPSDGVTVRRCHVGTVRQYYGATEEGLTMLGITMALVAYLITQMTANALNIYVTNQFLFWFLMAALLAGARSDPPSLQTSFGEASPSSLVPSSAAAPPAK